MTFRDLDALALVEPRLLYLKNELERLLQLVDLEHEGHAVRVDGFRLKSLSQWQTYRVGNALRAVTAPRSSDCGPACPYCGDEVELARRAHPAMTLDEVHTRLKYYDPVTGRTLFPGNPGHRETFLNRDALEIIEAARRREPGKLFSIATNGRLVTEDVVRRLADMRPLIVKLLADVPDPENPVPLERRSEVATRTAAWLEQHGIVFIANLIGGPADRQDEIEAAVREFERRRAYAVHVQLLPPRRSRPSVSEPGTDAAWEALIGFANEVAQRVDVAVLVDPDIYGPPKRGDARIAAVVLNSPAYRAGLRAGDVVRSINGRRVHAGIESETLLDQLHLAGKRADVTVRRDRRQWRVRLEDPPPGEDTYPYSADYFALGESYGIIHAQDVCLRYLRTIFGHIGRYGARKILLFTSAAFAPIFDAVVSQVPELAAQLRGIDLHLEFLRDEPTDAGTPSSDRAVVERYATVVRRRIDQGFRPDLILIPDAFVTPWGVDASGTSYMRLAIEFGIPVERIRDLSHADRDV